LPNPAKRDAEFDILCKMVDQFGSELKKTLTTRKLKAYSTHTTITNKNKCACNLSEKVGSNAENCSLIVLLHMCTGSSSLPLEAQRFPQQLLTL